MTGDYAMVLPLMLACVAAHYVAKVYRGGKSVYHASLNHQARHQESGPARIDTIETLVRPVPARTSPDAPVRVVLDRLGPTPPERIYLVEGQVLVAWLDARAAMERLMRAELNPETPVRLCAQPVSFALQPQMSLGAALDGFLKESASVLPVTSGQWANTLVGEVSRHDLLLAIQDQLSFRESPADAQGPA